MPYIITLISNILIISLFLSLSPTASRAEIVDKVLAQVGDNIVTQYDIDAYAPVRVRYINGLPENERKAAWQSYYDGTMKQYIDAYVVQVASARMGVTTVPEEVDQAVIALQEQNSAFRDELRRIIGREGVITPEVKLYVQTIVLQQKLLPMLEHRSVITNEDIVRYMREDMNLEPETSEYNIKILFLNDKDAYDSISSRLATEFDTIHTEVGASMIDMGYIYANSLLPEMGQIVRELEEGEVSEAYVDEEGRYVLIKLVDERPASGEISPQDKEYLTNTLRQRQMESIFNNWLERQRKTIIVYRYDG